MSSSAHSLQRPKLADAVTADADALIAQTERAARTHSSATRLFDLRIIIAALFGIYGVILTVTGLVHTTAAELEQTGGIRINLWGGVGMLVLAAVFALWAGLRPLRVQPADDADGSTPAPQADDAPADSGDARA